MVRLTGRPPEMMRSDTRPRHALFGVVGGLPRLTIHRLRGRSGHSGEDHPVSVLQPVPLGCCRVRDGSEPLAVTRLAATPQQTPRPGRRHGLVEIGRDRHPRREGRRFPVYGRRWGHLGDVDNERLTARRDSPQRWETKASETAIPSFLRVSAPSLPVWPWLRRVFPLVRVGARKEI